jgi:hypothetical protein
MSEESSRRQRRATPKSVLEILLLTCHEPNTDKSRHDPLLRTPTQYALKAYGFAQESLTYFIGPIGPLRQIIPLVPKKLVELRRTTRRSGPSFLTKTTFEVVRSAESAGVGASEVGAADKSEESVGRYDGRYAVSNTGTMPCQSRALR